jgi:glycosyltransferase involved in cell wall biosynthesis
MIGVPPTPARLDLNPSYVPLPPPMPVKDQTWPAGVAPVVSICCITYNHERFIHEALDGFLMQETTFPVEIVIRDDASTDNTRRVIEETAARHGRLFKTVFHRENQYRLGNKPFPEVMALAAGEFIAICEGDDYWIHPRKLERQVAFLRANPHYPFCFHPVLARQDKNGLIEPNSLGAPGRRAEYRLDDLLESNFVGTPSVVFRNRPRLVVPEWYGDCPFGDLPLHLLNLCRFSKETFGCLPEEMAVYRWHDGGVYQGASAMENAGRSERTQRLAAEKLRLNHRRSFRKGLANVEIQRCRAHRKQGNRRAALKSALAALKIAPLAALPAVGWGACLAMLPRINKALAKITTTRG